ncbi:HvfX family Cu-binding RiPP maturation protein [Thiohalobacter thiocyanaticus]|uniref:DoxX family protein n=1 Tax=Thiohalobacter thiocyanaticus TaxID=585455 RepID=A0A426QHR1_9GAMM|nr:DoxX family protein [Thiohalobacter thiocyanaticus]RRQ21282.1 DoxX family protein [Thiohalobacter thiocyanaticus]
MLNMLQGLQNLLDRTRVLDFLGPLALRLYLAPVFWMAGTSKLGDMENTIAWFGNPDWGLGLPAPALMAWLAALTETVGALLLLAGFAVRWISLPLMFTMLVAMVTVHWQHGWQAIADAKFCLFNCADAQAAAERLSAAREILREHGNYSWLTEQGSFVILNNGIEFAATYFIMLLVLFFMGAGRYLSLDYWIARRFRH